jgi:hypothetical protein
MNGMRNLADEIHYCRHGWRKYFLWVKDQCGGRRRGWKFRWHNSQCAGVKVMSYQFVRTALRRILSAFVLSAWLGMAMRFEWK